MQRTFPGLSGAVLALLLGVSVDASAQSLLGTPDAGQSMREVESTPLTLPEPSSLHLQVPVADDASAAPGGPTVQVAGFTLSGNHEINDAQLLPLLDDLKGRSVSLGELQAGAARITAYYRQQGYVLARAYLPAQEIQDGQVHIAILEGNYGQITEDNTSRVGGWALAPLQDLQVGDAVHVD